MEGIPAAARPRAEAHLALEPPVNDVETQPANGQSRNQFTSGVLTIFQPPSVGHFAHRPKRRKEAELGHASKMS